MGTQHLEHPWQRWSFMRSTKDRKTHRKTERMGKSYPGCVAAKHNSPPGHIK